MSSKEERATVGGGGETGNCGWPKGKSNQVESIIFVVVPVYCLYVLCPIFRTNPSPTPLGDGFLYLVKSSIESGSGTLAIWVGTEPVA